MTLMDRPAGGRARRRITAAAALVAAFTLTAGVVRADAASGAAAAPRVSAADASALASAAQLRSDQCELGTVLRLAGAAEKALAQQGLGGTPDQLRALATNQPGPTTPLQKASSDDFNASIAKSNWMVDRPTAWEQYIPQSNPPQYTASQWGSAPNFFDTVGLTKWVTNDYFADQSQVYADPTPMADKAASDAVLALGNQLYGSGSTTANTAEQDAWGALATELNNGGISADDARLLLEDGGFARSAPDSGTLPFRVAVEDLKARFAACGWANPPDPNGVLSDEVT